jgi:hypothetical protein
MSLIKQSELLHIELGLGQNHSQATCVITNNKNRLFVGSVSTRPNRTIGEFYLRPQLFFILNWKYFRG